MNCVSVLRIKIREGKQTQQQTIAATYNFDVAGNKFFF
jgi:hypothetical protein